MSLFRNNSISKHDQKGSWNRMVSKHVAVQTTASKPLSGKQAVDQRVSNQSKLVLPLTVALKKEISPVVAG